MRLKKDDLVLIGLLIIFMVVSVILIVRNNQFNFQEAVEINSSTEREIKIEEEEELLKQQEEQEKIFVHLGGAVVEPGVYEIEAGARLYQVIEEAGGPTAEADLNAINLVDQLRDGTRVMIPTQGSTSGNGAEVNNANSKVNINTANQKELETLQGVGPALAEQIMEYRRQNGGFSELAELKQVSGIGSKTFDNLKSQITY
ncbi:helix-hairpin-helix domain-containing protein [Natroniella acetigena]|uniref:helix-hairpin-helix domain-containing protein n=1 Tax=Natroniella acetigena TaxID=52004 RepID=UPI00200A6659|nr:helix-hairpin-helix domain-containing protein [Natroniella acetigena]MCK8826957.1 helix-hairpin-helix domain-containing protein [Natroniella acetigena]